MSINPNGTKFMAFWAATIKPGTPPDLIEHWRNWTLSGIERGRMIVKRLENYCHLENSLVLDIGSGYGSTSIACALAGARVVGLDPSEQNLRGAQIWSQHDYHLSTVAFLCGVGESLALPDESIDIVICDNVLEHVSSHAVTLSEIARVLRTNGLAFLSFPNLLSPQNFIQDPHYHMLGVSVLPPILGKFYVVNVRHRSHDYEVGLFPVASLLQRQAHNFGLQVIDQDPIMRRSFGWFTPLLRAFRMNTVPIITWILRRHGL